MIIMATLLFHPILFRSDVFVPFSSVSREMPSPPPSLMSQSFLASTSSSSRDDSRHGSDFVTARHGSDVVTRHGGDVVMRHGSDSVAVENQGGGAETEGGGGGGGGGDSPIATIRQSFIDGPDEAT